LPWICLLILAAVVASESADEVCSEHGGPSDCICPEIGWAGSETLPECKLPAEWITQPLNQSGSFENPCLDFRNEDMVTSFKSAVNALKSYYAFTEHKGINWDRVEKAILPKVTEASDQQSVSLYMEAILKMFTYIPDGQLSLLPFCNEEEYANLTKAHTGGSFGFAVEETDDGKFVVTYVNPSSWVSKVGVLAGDFLVKRGENGIPMRTWMLTRTYESYAWTLTPPFAEPPGNRTNPARKSSRRNALLKASMRAPVGSYDIFFFETAGKLNISAYDDNYLDLKAMKRRGSRASTGETIQSEILDSGLGYIAIADVMPIPAIPDGGWLDSMKQAMKKVNTTPGLIIDIRSNAGGVNFWASVFAAFFASSKVALYEKTGYPNDYLNTQAGLMEASNVTISDTGYSTLPSDIALDSKAELHTMAPRPGAYTGPVACIINDVTINSGEGLAWLCKTMIADHVVGFDSTHGSFGMAGSRIVLPGGNPPSTDAQKGFMISFPAFYSADVNGSVQLESDANGDGGVAPTAEGLIPSTADNLLAYVRGLMANDPYDDIELLTAETLLLGAPAHADISACTSYPTVAFQILCVAYGFLLCLM